MVRHITSVATTVLTCICIASREMHHFISYAWLSRSLSRGKNAQATPVSIGSWISLYNREKARMYSSLLYSMAVPHRICIKHSYIPSCLDSCELNGHIMDVTPSPSQSAKRPLVLAVRTTRVSPARYDTVQRLLSIPRSLG